MLRNLLTLFGPRKKVEVAPAKRLGLELSKIEGAVVTEKEFPRVQWNVVRDWLKTKVAEEDLPIAYYEIALDWMRRLRDRLGGSYEIFQSPHFMLLTARGAGPARSICQTCESAVGLLEDWLGPVASKRGHGKHVVLDFDTIENYYDYVSYFYDEERGVRASGGVFLRRGYQHIALPPLKNMKDTLIHELAHNRLAHRRLPAWLNEGIAVTMERKIGGNAQGRIDREKQRQHRAHWTPANIGTFWNGNSFHDDDGEVVGLSYSLADTFIDLLVQDFPNFREFAIEADSKDAGEAAALKCFGISLGELAATFLGPGDWEPKPSKESAEPS